MAVPKKKVSLARRRVRKVSLIKKLSKVNYTKCNSCGGIKRQHQLCMHQHA